MNDNIQLIMEGPCKNCNECELALVYYDDFYDARCEYEDTCEKREAWRGGEVNGR